jgi:hypothetical protein
MNTQATDLQLAELYRSWWKDSYGSTPNSQATVIAIAWAKHVINVLAPESTRQEV